MGKLAWGQPGQRRFEAGVSCGVLYPGSDPGVAWSGLTNVNVDSEGTEVEALYFDGVKYFDSRSIGDTKATINAYTYPTEFEQFEGVSTVRDGVLLAEQPVSSRFGMSYRTEIGNDLNPDLGYKIHLLYNLTVGSTPKSWKVVGSAIDPSLFNWDVSGVPEFAEGYRPTAYVVLDSTRLSRFLMADLEDILYGKADDPASYARLPPLEELLTFVSDWILYEITDNEDGTWTATTTHDDAITYPSPGAFQLEDANAVFLDSDTYEISTG